MAAIDTPQQADAPARKQAGDGVGRYAVIARFVDAAFLYGVVLLALAPVAYLFISSFNVANLGASYVFSTQAWQEVFATPGIVQAIANSLVLALRAIPAALIAFGISWVLVRFDPPGRRFIEVSMWFAFFMPSVPVAMAWILLLHKDYGLINLALAWIPFVPHGVFSIHSIGGIMWIHTASHSVPFLVLLFTPAIRQFDVAYEEAARVNGGGQMRSLTRIVWPMLLPVLIAAIIALFIKGLSSFEIEQLVGPPGRIYIFSTEIFSFLRQEPPLFAPAMALGTVLILTVVILGLAQFAVARLWPPRTTVQSQGARFRANVSPRARRLAAGIVVTYILVSIYLPVVVIAVGSFNKIFGLFTMAEPWTIRHWVEVFSDDSLFRAIRNSTLLGFVVALVALPIYFRLAWITTRRPVGGSGLAALLLWLPWALPGFVFGLGLLDVLLRVDLLAGLYGTLFPVMFALFIKELPLAVHFIRAGLSQLGTEFEEAAAVAGARRIAVFGQITLPLLSPTMVAVFIFVFLAAVQEIGTIVLVAAPGTQTISLLMFNYARTGHSESAAVIGVLYAVVALVLALFVNKRLFPVQAR